MPDDTKLPTSLIVPMRNETGSICALIESIKTQKFPPDDVILVDGGSIDDTVRIAKQCIGNDSRFRVIEAGDASPGKGRNIGVEAASNEWIAFTDAGIELEKDWLENLVEARRSNPQAEIVYGDYSPVVDTFFEKCACFAYVTAMRPEGIRGRFIASSLIKKSLWTKVGGFPDLRAAEDLMFMEEAEKLASGIAFAPKAMVHWQLQPGFLSTFRKFVNYSKHNIWAGRAWDWHYGILKQYTLMIPFIILALLHSFWWLISVPLWLLARAMKRIFAHGYEHGLSSISNPLVVLVTAGLILTIDVATILGWAQAKMNRGRE